MIRSIGPSDIPACARIMSENPLWQRYGVTYESAYQRFHAGVASNALIVISSNICNEVAGFIWYENRGAFCRSGYIMLIGVAPESQSSGIGSELMNHAEEHLFSFSSDVFLLVSDFNISAQRFYQRRGYVQIGQIDNYVLSGVNELIYRKNKRN